MAPTLARHLSPKPLFQMKTATPEEPTVEFIHQLAREGLSKLGHHGQMTSMGVPRHLLPHWDDLKVMARACGHDDLNKFNKDDLATWHREMALFSGVSYSGYANLMSNL